MLFIWHTTQPQRFYWHSLSSVIILINICLLTIKVNQVMHALKLTHINTRAFDYYHQCANEVDSIALKAKASTPTCELWHLQVAGCMLQLGSEFKCKNRDGKVWLTQITVMRMPVYMQGIRAMFWCRLCKFGSLKACWSTWSIQNDLVLVIRSQPNCEIHNGQCADASAAFQFDSIDRVKTITIRHCLMMS